MVSTRKNEVADETLVAVDDKVAAKLFRFLMMFDKICGGHALEVAPYGL